MARQSWIYCLKPYCKLSFTVAVKDSSKNLTLAFNFAYWQFFDRSKIFELSEHFFQKFESSLEV